MQNFMEQWSNFNKQNLLSVQKLADINSHFLMNLTQQQMDLMGIYVEGSNKHIQTLSSAKRVQDVLTHQSQWVEEFNKKMLNNARVTLEMMVDTKNQWVDWTETHIKQTAELNPLAKTAN
ncbi:MAG: phasin family protein [Pseudomonadota bacterium]|nr:phasin family protein [Pseudomonadota bacterium]